MNPELQRILSKYAELDRLADSGEDVVADLRKEINNLELAYLKDTVLPKVAKTFGGLVDGLRCDIDGNLTRYQDKNVEYAFGTSINMVMLKGDVNTSDCIEDTTAAMPAAVTLPKSVPVVIPDLRIEDYSERAIVVRGDTRQISDVLTSQNGILNFRLKGGAGWIFPKYRQLEIESILRPYMPNAESSELYHISDNRVKGNCKPSYGSEPKKSGIKAIRSVDIYIEAKSASQMLIDFVNAIGPETVRQMYIPYLGGFLVDNVKNNKYAKACFQLADGSWINTHSNTEVKIRLIKRICKALQRNVEFVMWEDTEYDYEDSTSQKMTFLSEPEPDLFNQAGVDIPLTHDEWIEKLLNMHAMQYKGFYAPHKAIFMLTIIEAINEGNIRENRIDTSSNLEEHFNKLWKEYVPSDWPFRSNFYQPYIHMGGESFYNLAKLEGIGDFDINQGWYRGLVSKYVEYTYFDERLFNLLHDKEFTERLARLLIDKFIERQQKHLYNAATKPLSNATNKSSYQGYREYLSTLTSNTGSKYSKSSIGIYSSALRSAYIRAKASKYAATEDIYAITDLTVIDLILLEVKQDPELRTINRSIYSALRMYRDYRKLNPIEEIVSKDDNFQKENYSHTDGVYSNENAHFGIVTSYDHKYNEFITKKSARSMFSLNGGRPMNKRQTVLEAIKLYVKTYPSATYNEIEMAFPKQLQGGYGVVARLSYINARWHEGQDVENRYYLERDKILKSFDNVDFVVCNQWGYNFKNFQKHIMDMFGWTIDEI